MMTAAAADTKYWRERLAALVAAVEAAEDGAYVTDSQGRVLYENAVLRRLLGTESERGMLEEAIADVRRTAGAQAGLRHRGVEIVPEASSAGQTTSTAGIRPSELQGRPVTLQVRTSTGEYRLRGTAMRGADGLRTEGITVVWVRRCRPRVLTPQTLRARYGLTPREVRVAALMAARAGSREIAQALGISPHTARRHAEAVLKKLGVHSRAEIRERLRE